VAVCIGEGPFFAELYGAGLDGAFEDDDHSISKGAFRIQEAASQAPIAPGTPLPAPARLTTRPAPKATRIVPADIVQFRW
jgi:hypothetical protein